MKSLVSIIVPAYNIKQYIAKCIDSIVSQTYKNLEIIIINDGSSDKTGDIITKKAKKDKRIKYFIQKNIGLSASRNKGIKKAKGKYIAFVDGDDLIGEEYIEKLVSSIEKEESDIAVCSFNTIRNKQITTERGCNKTIPGNEAVIQLLTKQNNLDIVAWNKLYRKDLFLKNQIFYPVGEIHEDTLTTYKLYAKAKKVAYIKDNLYYYYKHNNSITASTERIKSLGYKLRAAREATLLFSEDKDLSVAAEVAELLAYFSLIDAMLKQEIPYKNQYFEWIKDNKRRLEKNYLLSKKLRIYIKMVNKKDSWLYKLYRKIWH